MLRLRTNLAFSESSRSCTYTPFLPQGSKLSLISLYEQQFPRYVPILKIAIFGHETWSLAKVPEVAHILSFQPRGSKLSLFSLYGQWFPRYGPIFKIAMFGHETLPLAKIVPEIAYTLFLPQGVEIELNFALRADTEILADIQNCHIWA